MKKLYLGIIIAAAAGVSLTLGAPYFTTAILNQEPALIPSSIAESNNKFAVNFYKEISDSDENIFFSPISIYTAFSILYEGAEGETASQLRDTFGFEEDDAIRHNVTSYMAAAINQNDPYATLDIANALWIAKWFNPNESYFDIARSTYLAGAQTVDFTNTADSVDRINRWASDNTNGKIDNIISPDSVNKLTTMIINNAIYFKGTWDIKFPTENTKDDMFYRHDADPVTASFMNIESQFDYRIFDDAQILRMPYKGDRLSMFLILPTDTSKIEQFESELTTEQIYMWMDYLVPSEIKVTIPKFEVKTKYPLNNILSGMGITHAFDNTDADFSKIIDSNELTANLYVSGALHDAYIKINEDGTEAAAVTTIGVITDAEPVLPSHFNANHPFIFTIYDDHSNTILFMGRISDPTV